MCNAKAVPQLSSELAYLSHIKCLAGRPYHLLWCQQVCLHLGSSHGYDGRMAEDKMSDITARHSVPRADESRDRPLDGGNLREDDFRDSPMDRVTVPDAADKLGVTQSAVRKRIQRGTIPWEKDEDGKTFVYVDTLEPSHGMRPRDSRGTRSWRSIGTRWNSSVESSSERTRF
jgi:hypothetical protein